MFKWPWILRVLWDPIKELDLLDNDDKPDHGKILPAVLLISAIIFQALRQQYSWYALLALGSLSYGYGAWRTFIKAKSVSGSLTEKIENVRHVEEHIERKIIENRDHAEGFEPTPE